VPKHVRLLSEDPAVGAMQAGGEVTEQGHFDKKVMMVYCGKFESMDGPVEIKDEDIDKLVSNHNSKLAKLSRLASGEHDLSKMPPVQLDHSVSARDTVGRLVGDLTVGEYQPDGKPMVKAMFGTARFLGAENIERVKDGRWSHVSMGADLENHTLSELTVTPFPAAADASLLSRMRKARMAAAPNTQEYKGCDIVTYKDEAGQWYWEAVGQSGILESEASAVAAAKKAIDTFLKKNPDHKTKMGAPMPYKEVKEKAEMYAKCKKHLMDEKKMSEEAAEEHLAALADEDCKKMAADEDARMSKLAEEEAKNKEAEMKRMAGLKEQKEKVIKLSKDMRAHHNNIELARKKVAINTRLAKLRGDAKITPAEVKKIDLAKLAASTQEVIDATLKTYEGREPVIDVGLVGTRKAASLSSVSKKQLTQLGMERLELETRLNMESKRPEALKRLAELDVLEKELNRMAAFANEVPGGEPPAGDVDHEKLFAEMKGLMDAGKHDEAKEHLRKHLASRMSEEGMPVGPDTDHEMSALADGMKKMQTELTEVITLVSPVFGIKAEELV